MGFIYYLILSLCFSPPVWAANKTELRLDELSSILKNIEGVKGEVTGGKIVISGEIYREEDLNVINRLTEQHRTVVNLTTVAPFLIQIKLDQLRGLANSLGYTNFQLVPGREKIVIKGVVKSEDEKKNITKLLEENSSLASPLITIGNSGGSTIVIDLELYEINKHDLDSLGITPPAGVTASGNISYRNEVPTLSLSAKTISDAVLHTIKQNSGTKILANPRLTCQSGEEASFLAGGEIPISAVSREGFTSVTYKPYGISLKIQPTLISDGRIALNISSEISSVDRRVEGQGAPSFLTRRFSTFATVSRGIPLLLTGLFHMEGGDEISSLPIIGSLPVIGKLLSSSTFRKRESHLVGILTAYLQNETDGFLEAGIVKTYRPFIERPLWIHSSE